MLSTIAHYFVYLDLDFSGIAELVLAVRQKAVKITEDCDQVSCMWKKKERRVFENAPFWVMD
jgi:hypothetical protein